MSNRLTVSVLQSEHELQALTEDWPVPADRERRDCAFLRHEWMLSWWSTIGSMTASGLFVLAVRDGETLVGLLPLVRYLHGTTVVLRLIGSPNSDYTDVLGADRLTVLSAIFAFLRERSDWHRVELDQLPWTCDFATSVEALLTAARLRYTLTDGDVTVRYRHDSSIIAPSDFTVDRNRTFRKKMNALSRMGDVQFQIVTTDSAIRPYLSSLFHMHAIRWSDTPTPSKFLRAEHRSFYEKIIAVSTPYFNPFMGVLRIDREVLACLLGFRSGQTAQLYTVGSASYQTRRSPGIAVYLLTTEELVRSGCQVVDFGRGEQGHKDLFVNDRTTNRRLCILARARDFMASRLLDTSRRIPAVRRIGIKGRSVVRTVLSAVEETDARSKRSDASPVSILFARHVSGNARSVLAEKLGEAELSEIADFLGLADATPEAEKLRYYLSRMDCWALRFQAHIQAIAWSTRVAPFTDRVVGPPVVEISRILRSPLYLDTAMVDFFVADLIAAAHVHCAQVRVWTSPARSVRLIAANSGSLIEGPHPTSGTDYRSAWEDHDPSVLGARVLARE